MVGDALVFENDRLLVRMNQFFDKVEATLKQCLRESCTDPHVRAGAGGVCCRAAASLLSAPATDAHPPKI